MAVFDPLRWEKRELPDKVYNLIAEDRARFVAPPTTGTTASSISPARACSGRIAHDEAGYGGTEESGR